MQRDINQLFESILCENIDRKAIFICGQNGSGKNIIVNILDKFGLQEVHLSKLSNFINDNTLNDNIIVNCDNVNYDEISNFKTILENCSFRTSMFFVNVSDDISRQRNISRLKSGGRILSEDVRQKKYLAITETKYQFQKLFNTRYFEYDNSTNFNVLSEEVFQYKLNELVELLQFILKDDLIESIDFNIEPGMPMNGFSKEKLDKKGKVTMAELTGDETTDSISAQKEGELKRKGISLSTFKARNSI